MTIKAYLAWITGLKYLLRSRSRRGTMARLHPPFRLDHTTGVFQDYYKFLKEVKILLPSFPYSLSAFAFPSIPGWGKHQSVSFHSSWAAFGPGSAGDKESGQWQWGRWGRENTLPCTCSWWQGQWRGKPTLLTSCCHCHPPQMSPARAQPGWGR